MTEVEAKKPQESPQDHLAQVVKLLHRHKVTEDLAHRQEGQYHNRVENLVYRQNLVELQRKLEELHPTGIAYTLRSLPLDDRLTVWQPVRSEDDGDVFLEVSDVVRGTLVADMDDHEIIVATKDLDANELADLVPELPRDATRELTEGLDAQQRRRVRLVLSYEEDQVSTLMGSEMVTIREDVSLEVVLRYLRRLKELSGRTDKLSVIDYDGVSKGVLSVKRLLVNDPDKQMLEVMTADPVTFHLGEDGYGAAQIFERYDLTSTPVVDKGSKLINRLTVDETVDLIREEGESEVLNMAGLHEGEDIFASAWKSVRNHWTWLATNLTTAFAASQVIGPFEDSIKKLVALVVLMSIVADIGDDPDNQTIATIVRAIALDQVQPTSNGRDCLLRKELGVAPANGLAWSEVAGVITFYLYGNWELDVVITVAMTLNLLLAAMMGVLIPMTLRRFRHDSTMSPSVTITAVTDSGGLFILLGLTVAFLV